MRQNRVLKALHATLFSILFAGLAAGTAVAREQEKLTVRLDFTPVGFHTAMYLAKEKGWFDREGLDVEIQDGTGSLNTIQLVAAGQVDIGQIQLGLMALALDKKLPIKSFAGYVRGSDLSVMVPRDSSIDTVADLAGKKILCFNASPWAPFIDSFLTNGGTSRDKVDITMVAPSTMVGLYSAKEADGFMSVEPYAVPMVEKTRPAKTLRMSDYGIHFPSYGLIATMKVLEQRKEALRKFNKVQIETWEYIWKGHEDEAVDALIKLHPGANLDRAVLRAQLELNRDLFYTQATKDKRIGWQAASDWEQAIGSMKTAGIIAGNPKPEDFFTNDLMPDESKARNL